VTRAVRADPAIGAPRGTSKIPRVQGRAAHAARPLSEQSKHTVVSIRFFTELNVLSTTLSTRGVDNVPM